MWFHTYGFGEILEGFMIGAFPIDASDVAMLQMMGVTRIVNLVEDGEYEPGAREAVVEALREAGIEEQRISLVDFGGLPREQLQEAVDAVRDSLGRGEVVYAHCRAGWQRSAALAAGVVALERGLEIEDALQWVRQAKPSAEPLEHQREDLFAWWAGRSGEDAGRSGEDAPVSEPPRPDRP